MAGRLLFLMQFLSRLVQIGLYTVRLFFTYSLLYPNGNSKRVKHPKIQLVYNRDMGQRTESTISIVETPVLGLPRDCHPASSLAR
jgi:hypothetical protein